MARINWSGKKYVTGSAGGFMSGKQARAFARETKMCAYRGCNEPSEKKYCDEHKKPKYHGGRKDK